jgi:hypothetical protein
MLSMKGIANPTASMNMYARVPLQILKRGLFYLRTLADKNLTILLWRYIL